MPGVFVSDAELPDLALADLALILELDSANVEALYRRGTLHAKLGLLDDAIDDLSTVLRLDPNHINASYARAACRNRQGDYNQAIGEGWLLPCSLLSR
jgi:tetratricopeptide (TPR) repeat protein